jgi:hypothetical protein
LIPTTTTTTTTSSTKTTSTSTTTTGSVTPGTSSTTSSLVTNSNRTDAFFYYINFLTFCINFSIIYLSLAATLVTISNTVFIYNSSLRMNYNPILIASSLSFDPNIEFVSVTDLTKNLLKNITGADFISAFWITK